MYGMIEAAFLEAFERGAPIVMATNSTGARKVFRTWLQVFIRRSTTGIAKGFGSFNGGTLHCKCPTDKVEVRIAGDVAHNHACGCSKCWKPKGALFSIVGVVPVAKVKVLAHEEKLHIVDESATIQRHACKGCGVHMYRPDRQGPSRSRGSISSITELSDQKGWQAPQFAAFCSSIIEQGFEPGGMAAVRDKFKSLGLPTSDALSPALNGRDRDLHLCAHRQARAGRRIRRADPGEAGGRDEGLPRRPARRPCIRRPVAKKPGGIAGFFSKLFRRLGEQRGGTTVPPRVTDAAGY